jgi:hypothetical protein
MYQIYITLDRLSPDWEQMQFEQKYREKINGGRKRKTLKQKLITCTPRLFALVVWGGSSSGTTRHRSLPLLPPTPSLLRTLYESTK